MSGWAVELAAALKGKQTDGELETALHIAQVKSVSPFTIAIQGQPISQNLHIPSSLQWRAELSPAELEDIFRYDGLSTPAWLSFLKEFYKQCIAKPGDQVVVLQVGSDFYVLGAMQ